MIFSSAKPTILIVDDEPINVEILASLFNQDYYVKVAGNGKTALEIARQYPQPDLILLDIMMPEMDGFEVCKRLKADAKTENISVMFVTASTGDSSESQGLHLGAVDYITKPINRHITKLRVQNHLALRESQKESIEQGGFLNALIDNAPQAVLVMSVNYQWLLINKTGLEFLQCTTIEQANTVEVWSFIDFDYRDAYIDCAIKALGGVTKLIEVRVTGFQGDSRFIEISFSPLYDAKGQVVAILNLASDISSRKQAEAKLRLWEKVFKNAQEGILITDVSRKIEDVNPAFIRLSGYSRAEALGRNPDFLQSGRQSEAFYEDMWQALQDNGRWQGEIWNRKKNGEFLPEWLSISAMYDDYGKLEHYLGVYTDISQLKIYEKQLEKIAHYDGLTGIPNRVLLEDRMKQAIAYTKREQDMFAVCYLDLDGFKPVNDTLGHAAGDLVLIETAIRIRNMLRETDTVARLGGDEFVVLLQNIKHLTECTSLLDRLLSVISEPIKLNDNVCQVSASIGFTLFPLDNEDPDILLRHADQAMYVAKNAGKSRCCLFDPEL